MNEDEQQPPCPGHTGCTPGDGQAIQQTATQRRNSRLQGFKVSAPGRTLAVSGVPKCKEEELTLDLGGMLSNSKMVHHQVVSSWSTIA